MQLFFFFCFWGHIHFMYLHLQTICSWNRTNILNPVLKLKKDPTFRQVYIVRLTFENSVIERLSGWKATVVMREKHLEGWLSPTIFPHATHSSSMCECQATQHTHNTAGSVDVSSTEKEYIPNDSQLCRHLQGKKMLLHKTICESALNSMVNSLSSQHHIVKWYPYTIWIVKTI